MSSRVLLKQNLVNGIAHWVGPWHSGSSAADCSSGGLAREGHGQREKECEGTCPGM